MAIRRLVLGLALSLAAGAGTAGELVGQVVGVHDGDTLTVLVDRRQVKARLASIDAPELGQPFGNASRKELAAMCAGGIAYVEDQGRDRYGRTLGQVRCSSLDVNTELVRRGMAWVYVRYAPPSSPLYQLEAQAKRERRGLWADPSPMPPWEWRSRKREGGTMR